MTFIYWEGCGWACFLLCKISLSPSPDSDQTECSTEHVPQPNKHQQLLFLDTWEENLVVLLILLLPHLIDTDEMSESLPNLKIDTMFKFSRTVDTESA